MVEFVSYDGEYPNLCRGDLVVRIDGKEVNLGRCLHPGGFTWIDEDLHDHIAAGEWSVRNIPEEFKQYTKEITEVVNENVPWGCCGGCI